MADRDSVLAARKMLFSRIQKAAKKGTGGDLYRALGDVVEFKSTTYAEKIHAETARGMLDARGIVGATRRDKESMTRHFTMEKAVSNAAQARAEIARDTEGPPELRSGQSRGGGPAPRAASPAAAKSSGS